MPDCITTFNATSNLPFQNLDHGRYQLLQLLGSGSFGTVYKAIDNKPASPEDPHYIAIKSIAKSEPGSSAQQGFRREFLLQQKVSAHENIISVHDTFEQDDHAYIVMELADSEDLFSAIMDKGIFKGNDELIKSVFVKIIDALHHCHQNNVFHRDLKPDNILCSSDGQKIRLADFGLSTNRKLSSNFGCGSGPYKSPECIGTETGNARYSTLHNDIWAMGVILLNMITGHLPWTCAHSSDQGYAAYLNDQDVLRHLPISDSALQLLKRILVLNPLSRITLPVLRREILAIDTFFAPEPTLTSTRRLCRDVSILPHYDSSFSSESTSSDGSPNWSSADSDEQMERLQGIVLPNPSCDVFTIGSLSKSSLYSSSDLSVMEVQAKQSTCEMQRPPRTLRREVRRIPSHLSAPRATHQDACAHQDPRPLHRQPRFCFAGGARV